MLRRERFHTVQREHHLCVDRLFTPQGAVVVEDGDALGHGNEVRAAHRGHPGDKTRDRVLRAAAVPRLE